MKAYLIAIGDEVLSGRTLDTNSNFIASQLDNIGVSVIKISVISDKIENINYELNQAFNSEASFIFSTGGLGPTKDDKTKQVITDFLADELILNTQALEYIKKLYEKNGRILNKLTHDQALAPSRSQVIINKYGTAPILWSVKNSKVLINLPGVPYETRAMIKEEIIPKIKREFLLDSIIRYSITVINTPESELAMQLENWEDNLPPYISLAYLPGGAQIELRLTAIGKDKNKLEKDVINEVGKLPALLGKNMLDTQKRSVEHIINKLLSVKGYTLSVSESITGGKISEKITSVPGSSAFYLGGVIAYNDLTKESILSVKKETIEKHSAVSEEVVIEMVKNTAEFFNTDIALATTGVAGPDSDSSNNPIGLAYVGLFYKGDIITKKYFYPNLTRDELIIRISNKALEMLYSQLILE